MPARGFSWELSGGEQIACKGLGFHAGLIYAELSGEDPGEVLVDAVFSEGVCRIKLCTSFCEEELAGEVERYLLVGFLTGVPHLCFEVNCGHGGECANLHSLSLDVVNEVVDRYVLALVEESRVWGRELFLVTGWNGVTVAGVGEKYNVTLPRARVVVHVHTHPGFSCLPSGRDFEEYAGLFAEGTIATIVASSSCVFALRVTSFFVEEDYDLLLSVAKCMAKARDYSSQWECVARLREAKGLEYVVASI